MSITYIKRITGSTNNLVYIETTDSTAVATAAGYITAQTANITALNDGVWTWETNDCIMLSASDGISWCSIDPSFTTLIVFASSAISEEGLAGLGIYSALYTNTGGSATTTVTDPNIEAADVVVARWQSSANTVAVRTVLPAAGSITVVSSADPGASVLEYIAYRPSTRLQAAGVIVSKPTYAGGSASFTISAPLVTSDMIVNANFQSQTNAAQIQTVTAGAGTLSFVANTNPGASVIEYSAISSSAALEGIGLYAEAYTNAGGSATISITDANITASSIVTADFSTQANAAYVAKVTPSSGTLTILASADPGASIVDYISTATASPGGSSENGSFNRIVASTTTSSATPGTIRDIYGRVVETATTMTSGNLVGVRGEVDLVGASGGFIYGVQGKVTPTGTLSGSVWAPAVFGQYDLSAATLNAGQIAAIWGDMGATGGTFTNVTGARMFAGTNTIATLTLNSMIYLYGKATSLLELSGSSSTYITTGAATPSGTINKIAITIDGVVFYLIAATVWS